MRNAVAVIHPEPFPAPMISGGSSRISINLYLRRGKIDIGSMVFHAALTDNSTVTRSAETVAPTCFTFFEATSFLGFRTVVTPVSSKLQILEGSNLCLNMISPSFPKKNLFFVCFKICTGCFGRSYGQSSFHETRKLIRSNFSVFMP